MKELFTIYKRRLNRKNYFFGNLILFLLLVGVMRLSDIVRNTPADYFDIVSVFLFVIILVLVIYFSYAFLIARLHDFGKSGRFAILGLIPVINTLGVFVVQFIPGEKKKNKYGPVQK